MDEKTLKFGKRLALIAAFPLVSIAIILMGMDTLTVLPEEAAYRVTTAHRFLGIVIVAYIVNFMVAWKYAQSFSVSMIRMLIFAVVAYLSLSSSADVFLNNRDMLSSVLGLAESTQSLLVTELRSRLAAYIAALILSCVCIGIGFENKGEDGSGLTRFFK